MSNYHTQASILMSRAKNIKNVDIVTIRAENEQLKKEISQLKAEIEQLKKNNFIAPTSNYAKDLLSLAINDNTSK